MRASPMILSVRQTSTGSAVKAEVIPPTTVCEVSDMSRYAFYASSPSEAAGPRHSPQAKDAGPVGLENSVLAGQAALRYWWMRPLHRVDLSTVTVDGGAGDGLPVALGGRCSSER